MGGGGVYVAVGACVAGGHAWQGGVCGGGRVWWGGACVAGGCAWQGACVACPPSLQALGLRYTVNKRAVRILLECILV